MRGKGVWADLMSRRFTLALQRFGLELHQPALRSDLFCPPARAGDQMSLL
jgi:hypothetical protein